MYLQIITVLYKFKSFKDVLNNLHLYTKQYQKMMKLLHFIISLFIQIILHVAPSNEDNINFSYI